MLILGNTLQRLPKSSSADDGHDTIRRLLPERRTSRRGPLAAEQRHHGNKTAQQHVHV